MNQITIQCRLVASESTRQLLWKLMAEKNTPLINELIEQVTQHDDFELWRQKGKIPSSAVSQLCQSLRTDPRFQGQPARFYTSASHAVDYIYKSWLKLQKRLQDQLQGKIRWLEILKSDRELIEISNCDRARIRQKATEILASITVPSPTERSETQQTRKRRKSKQAENSSSSKSVSSLLVEAYSKTTNILDRCAISYLLKNRCQVTECDEESDKFAKRRRKVEIQIKRLQEQLEGRLPKGRDLTGQSWLNTLVTASTTVPQDNTEAKRW